MKNMMKALLRRENLTRDESYRLVQELLLQPAEQQGAVLALLASKGETLDELLGVFAYLFSQCCKVQTDLDVMDIAGTGGDGKGTFNISTLASIVVAGCGVTIGKHGGRSASSDMGSADLISALGIKTNADARLILSDLREKNYAYLYAPLFNPVLNKLAAMRKNLGIATVFNSLCPLLNPLNPKRQLLGINNKQHLRLYAELAQRLGKTHVMIVHSADGLDEISVSGETFVAELRDGKISEYCISPEQAGLKISPLAEVVVANSHEKIKIIHGILNGKITDAKLDIVLLNSAAALMMADRATTLREGVELAHDAIQSGKALRLLSELQEKHS